jgi:hypothetical protein
MMTYDKEIQSLLLDIEEEKEEQAAEEKAEDEAIFLSMLQEDHDNMVLVQYCPCGHTGYRLKSEVKVNPNRLDAPTKHSSECAECLEDRVRSSDSALDAFVEHSDS